MFTQHSMKGRNINASKSELDLQEAMCTLGRKFDSQESLDAMMNTDPSQLVDKVKFSKYKFLNE